MHPTQANHPSMNREPFASRLAKGSELENAALALRLEATHCSETGVGLQFLRAAYERLLAAAERAR